MQVERKVLTSVGIDIGTTTTHIVFSRLTLESDPFSRTRRLKIVDRQVTYRSRIHFTPLKQGNRELDLPGIVDIIKQEYMRAGVDFTEVDAGAVIVTGESSRKVNASLIVERISEDTGRFVAASAGPNFESVISAHGSGAVRYSREHGVSLLHCDIGGGTSNIAYIVDGEVKATACINIGGRLIAYDETGAITRLEKPGRQILSHLGYSLDIGDKITPQVIEDASTLMAYTLIEHLKQQPPSTLTEELLSTAPIPVEVVKPGTMHSFSGGVAEYIYGNTSKEYGDLGHRLGEAIKALTLSDGLSLVELPEKIRATVIGACSFTLQVSGFTTYSSSGFTLPVRNMPVATPIVDKLVDQPGYVAEQVGHALERLDTGEAPRQVVLGFHDPVKLNYGSLKRFVAGVEEALNRYRMTKVPLVLVFDTDIGNSVGNTLRNETLLKGFLSIDEIDLKEGDFIDVGEPLNGESLYPVVVKSLVFE